MKTFLLILSLGALAFSVEAVFKDTAFNIVSTLVDKISQRSDASSSLTTCDCGRAKGVNTRIINGVKTSLEGPFSSFVQVISTANQKITCSGFIVTPLHIVTAAHCVKALGTAPENIAIVAGNPYYEIRTGMRTKYTQQINVSQVHSANYTGDGNRSDDIAILVLEKPLEFNQMVSRACLPKESEDLGGQQGRIAGWGGIKNDSIYLEDQIVEGKVIILSAEKCNKYWQLIPKENPKQICVVSVRSTQQRASEGDSGSPVLWYDDSINRYVAVGVISYGLADRSFNYPRVNTKVSEYLSFINSIVESTSNEQTCSKR